MQNRRAGNPAEGSCTTSIPGDQPHRQQKLLTVVLPLLALELKFYFFYSSITASFFLRVSFAAYCINLKLPHSKQFIYAVTVSFKCVLFALCFPFPPLFNVSRFIKYKCPNACQLYYPFGRPQGIICFINHIRSKQLVSINVSKIHRLP